MRRFFPVIVLISLAFALASCVQSPSGPGASPVSGSSRPRTEAALDGEGGGILLWSEQIAEWCSCAPPPELARVREGTGVRFFWAAVDPVAADRFAQFRFSVNGSPPSDWGSLRGWPESDEGEPPTFWFPAAGTNVFRVEKLLGGEITSLEAEFEVVGR